MHGDYLLDRDRLFKVSDSLEIDEVSDDAVRDSLKEYLRRFKSVDWYVTQNDYLWKKSSDVVELYYETNEGPISKVFVENEYYDIMKPYRFKQDFEKIYLEMEFDYKNCNNADLDNIFTEFRVKGGVVDFFRGYKLSNLSTPNAEGSMHYKVKTTFFLTGNDIKDADFIIDIYSKVKFDFEYKNLKIRVEGHPLRSRL